MSNLILIVAILVPAVAMVLTILAWRFMRRRDKRRSPLTLKFQNLPGDGLRKAISKHDDAIDEAGALVMVTGPVLLSAWLLARMDKTGVDWSGMRFGVGDAMFLIVGVLLLAWSLWRLVRHAGKRRNYVDGLQAEQMVAQCLTPVIADGGIVFHDFPADHYNIDHIVIGSSVVFAIETKWRKKPADTGKNSARVQYDGSQLIFPHHAEAKPVEQAGYQAEWLSRFLASAVGETVRVVPVLALPGWFVENTNRAVRHPVLVTNCHNSRFMMGDKFGPALPEPLRHRVAHVLAAKYPQPGQ